MARTNEGSFDHSIPSAKKIPESVQRGIMTDRNTHSTDGTENLAVKILLRQAELKI
jgi:hypothetical protein